MPRLRTEATSLAGLITYFAKYTVPDYQRVYAWGEDHVERLLSDVGGSATSSVYVGAIYLSGDAERTRAEIADGQQRLLTLNMLYAVGRDLCEDVDEAAALHAMLISPADGSFRFTPREGDAAFFAEWVQTPGATLRDHAVDHEGGRERDDDATLRTFSESRRHIITNRDLLVAKLRALGEVGRRELFGALATNAEVVVIVAPTLDEARNAYASTHARGLAQAPTDKLKAELIGDLPAPQRARLASQWERCEADLGRENLAELFEQLVIIGGRRKPQYALESDLTHVFGLPANIEPFIEETLVPAAQAYKRLLSANTSVAGLMRGRKRQQRINDHLVTLLRTSHSTWKAPALVALRRMGDDSEALMTFLADLERLAAAMMIAGTDPGEMTKRYVHVIQDLDADPKGRARALELTPSEIRAVLERLRERRVGERERFRMPVLLKLNDLLNKAVVPIDPKLLSCEHVLPRNAPPRSPWRELFRTADGRRFDGGPYVHALGNLTLLSHEDNRRADTRPFAEKQKIFKKSDYAISCDAAREAAWTPDVVRQRTERLVGLLAAHWRLHAAR